MSLNKVNYVDDQTVISAQNMNDIQDEIIYLEDRALEFQEYINEKSSGVFNEPMIIDCQGSEGGQFYFISTTQDAYDPKIFMNDGYGRENYYSELTPHKLSIVEPYGRSEGEAITPVEIYLGYYNKDSSASSHTKITPGKIDFIKRVGAQNLFSSYIEGDYFSGRVNWNNITGKPEGLATKEYVDNKVANKVDKVNGKGLSDVNFTKEYEDEVKSIDIIRRNISNVSMKCDDLEDIFLSGTATMARATEIAVNPHGASLSAQNMWEEFEKLAFGQSSDKIFIDDNEGITFVKMSDKIPTPEDMTKGFTMIVSMLSSSTSSLPSIFPPMSPFEYIHVGNMNMDSDGWNFVIENLTTTDGMMIFFEGLIIVVNDINNPFGIPEGVYTTIISSGDISTLCSGLQISGFDLSSSSASVS